MHTTKQLIQTVAPGKLETASHIAFRDDVSMIKAAAFCGVYLSKLLDPSRTHTYDNGSVSLDRGTQTSVNILRLMIRA